MDEIGLAIPDICNFLYTTVFFGLKIVPRHPYDHHYHLHLHHHHCHQHQHCHHLHLYHHHCHRHQLRVKANCNRNYLVSQVKVLKIASHHPHDDDDDVDDEDGGGGDAIGRAVQSPTFTTKYV